MEEPPADHTVEAPQPRAGRTGLLLVLAATAIAGISGYAITWLVPRVVGFGDYAGFAVFWSLLFLIASALSGIQQEITRATERGVRDASGAPRSRARTAVFALGAVVVVVVVVASTSALWGRAFPEASDALIWPLLVGAAASVFVAALTGTLYGVHRWKAIFWIVVVEAAVRLAAIGVALAFDADIAVLAWAVVLPFPLAFVTVWLASRRALVGTSLDVGYRQLTWNVARTIVAAASMGLMVSGFPFVLALTAGAESAETLGLVVIATTLVRAPLIVTAMALQSYLIVFFRERRSAILGSFLAIEGGVVAVGGLLGVVGWLAGPAVFGLLFPGQPVPDGWFIAALVFSSALLAGLCVSAPAVLARSDHAAYTTGWLLAALVTIVLLMLPIGFLERTTLALLLGPVAGLSVHATSIVAAARNVPGDGSAAPVGLPRI
ncbi:hypothetical protein [Agromyces ramosus]|nr:hypothetical protein [Agromyces ramosus]